MTDEQGRQIIDEMKKLNRVLKGIVFALVVQALFLLFVYDAINTHR